MRNDNKPEEYKLYDDFKEVDCKEIESGYEIEKQINFAPFFLCEMPEGDIYKAQNKELADWLEKRDSMEYIGIWSDKEHNSGYGVEYYKYGDKIIAFVFYSPKGYYTSLSAVAILKKKDVN